MKTAILLTITSSLGETIYQVVIPNIKRKDLQYPLMFKLLSKYEGTPINHIEQTHSGNNLYGQFDSTKSDAIRNYSFGYIDFDDEFKVDEIIDDFYGNVITNPTQNQIDAFTLPIGSKIKSNITNNYYITREESFFEMDFNVKIVVRVDGEENNYAVPLTSNNQKLYEIIKQPTNKSMGGYMINDGTSCDCNECTCENNIHPYLANFNDETGISYQDE